MALLILVAAAGCGTSDPSTWDTCAGCAEMAGSQWDVIADGAELSGDFDVLGPPDPYLCVSLLGQTHCSAAMSDSASPRWDDTLFRAVATADLTTQTVEADLWDKDTGGLDTNDFVCSVSVTITPADLDAGGILFDCPRAHMALRFHHAD